MRPKESKARKKILFFSEGRLYFSLSQERRFFFLATVVMAVLGLLYHWGIFN